jgi:hypothetical protein
MILDIYIFVSFVISFLLIVKLSKGSSKIAEYDKKHQIDDKFILSLSIIEKMTSFIKI